MAQIQKKAANNSGATTIPVILGSSPIDGNFLYVVIGTLGSAANEVSSITQTGATWVKAVQADNTGVTIEIWYAENVSGASASITINLASSLTAACMVVEWDSILTSGSLDKTSSGIGNWITANPDTGTTATTAQANELIVVGFADTNPTFAWSTPSIGYTNVGESDAIALATVTGEKTVSSTGTQNGTDSAHGATIPDTGPWAAVIATFQLSSSIISATAVTSPFMRTRHIIVGY